MSCDTKTKRFDCDGLVCVLCWSLLKHKTHVAVMSVASSPHGTSGASNTPQAPIPKTLTLNVKQGAHYIRDAGVLGELLDMHIYYSPGKMGMKP